MDNPISVDDNGAKIKPELMENEKLYHCIYKDKVLLFYKDDQDFLNCYEIEEPDLVNQIEKCNNTDDVEKFLDDYIQKQDLNN